MQLLPISTLRAMNADEITALAVEAVKTQKRAVEATETHKGTFKAVGKVLCVVEENLNTLKSEKRIASNVSLPVYWASITKTNAEKVKLNPHWYSCAVAFGTYFRTGLCAEAQYDKNTAQCLEIAARISTKVGGDVTHEAILEAADVLNDISEDSVKSLKAILASVSEPEEITPEDAKEMLAKIFAQCPSALTTVVIPGVAAEIAHLKDAETAKSAFLGIDVAVAMFERNMDETGARRFSDETISSWITSTKPGEPVKFVHAATAETPQPAPAEIAA